MPHQASARSVSSARQSSKVSARDMHFNSTGGSAKVQTMEPVPNTVRARWQQRLSHES